MSVKDYFKRLFVVHKCVSCREILDYKSFDNALCSECRTEFEVAKTQSCPECYRAACECSCQPPTLSKAGSLTLRKLFFYSADKDKEAQNKMVYFLKHHPSKRGFEFCADQLYKLIDQDLYFMGLDPLKDVFVVNVPRGPESVKRYGFDQSKEICKAISKKYAVQYIEALSRRFGGKEQKKLNVTQRRKNIEGHIYPNKKAARLTDGKYAILFDDIVTTGASMSECIKILKKMGVKSVMCVTLAADLKNKHAR